ncbi:MAG TPA: tetratricopeptide repeat protein [Acetobacteraceae bacterium]|nr:tetratricopeptide repeat protein [Acetobacteraceae bacterium]
MSALQPGVDVAQAALRGGSPQTALQIASHVLQTAPGNEAALVVQGDALTELGRVDDARISYTEALKSNPESVGGEIGLGRLDLSSDPAKAEALLLEALQRDPRNTTALNDLGVARDLRGNHAGAQTAYRQALGINPQDTAAEVNLALSMAMSGSAGEAVDMLRPLASAPGASRKMQHDLAAALTMAGNRPEAARILSADLSPAQVQQALDAYAAARSGGPAALAVTPPATESAIALAPPAATTSPVQVQLAAVPTQAAAQAAWQHLQQQMPTLVSGRQPVFVEVERNGQVFWRLRTGGFADEAQALAFCHQAQAAGAACALAGSEAP